MNKRELPSQFVIREHGAVRWIPFVALIPLVITVVVFIGMTVTDSPSLDEWRTPLLGIGSIALVGMSVGWLFDRLMIAWEIRSIKQVYEQAWVVWPIYSDEEKWQRFIESDHGKALNNSGLSVVPIVIVGVIVTIISGAAVLNDAEVSIIYGMVGFLLIVIGIVVGGWFTNKWEINARYKRRKNAPPPVLLISHNGYYNEDQGYRGLKRMQKVDLKAPGKRRPAKITFIVKRHWLEHSIGDDTHVNVPREWPVTIDVPKGYETEAEALVERFRSQVLKQS